MTTTQSLTIYGPNLPRNNGGALHVHAEGCADTRKAFYRGAQSWTAEFETKLEAVYDIYPPSDFDYDPADHEAYSSDVTFFPCVKLPFEAASRVAE